MIIITFVIMTVAGRPSKDVIKKIERPEKASELGRRGNLIGNKGQYILILELFPAVPKRRQQHHANPIYPLIIRRRRRVPTVALFPDNFPSLPTARTFFRLLCLFSLQFSLVLKEIVSAQGSGSPLKHPLGTCW